MSNDFKSVLEVRTEVRRICVGGIGIRGEGPRGKWEGDKWKGKGNRVMGTRRNLFNVPAFQRPQDLCISSPTLEPEAAEEPAGAVLPGTRVSPAPCPQPPR